MEKDFATNIQNYSPETQARFAETLELEIIYPNPHGFNQNAQCFPRDKDTGH